METSVIRILSSLTALTVAAPLAVALAGEPTHYYPRLPGDSTNQQVEYAPGSTGNVVGGAAATFVGGDNDRAVFSYGAGQQQPSAGLPVFIGVDDGRPVIAYVPVAQDAGSAMAGAARARAPRG